MGIFIIFLIFFALSLPSEAATKNILVTGFWSPSNEMLRPFSPNPAQNHGAWIGKNWRGLGYDVYAYFPEFPKGSGSVGRGDFRVDFAPTYRDFFKYTELLKPIAIVSFGAGAGPWEVEVNFPQHFRDIFLKNGAPASLTGNTRYFSSLPLENIVRAVNAGRDHADAYVDYHGSAGGYLCGFMGYLETWYQGQHSDPQDPAYTAMAGFIHVGGRIKHVSQAVNATLEAVIQRLPK